MLTIQDYKNILYNKRQDKYQIKCIEYFIQENYIVFGNTNTRNGYLPICFKHLNNKEFKAILNIENWETLFKQKELAVQILDMKLDQIMEDKRIEYE